jgi:hypothetical protein
MVSECLNADTADSINLLKRVLLVANKPIFLHYNLTRDVFASDFVVVVVVGRGAILN